MTSILVAECVNRYDSKTGKKSGTFNENSNIFETKATRFRNTVTDREYNFRALIFHIVEAFRAYIFEIAN